MTPTELAGEGITLPDFVNLKGIGAKENIVLKGELPDTTTLDESARLSTLNLRCNNNLYNLTVTAKNCRYAVHADNGNNIKDYTQHIENCEFIHFNNAPGLWVTLIAWGRELQVEQKFTLKTVSL